MTLPALRVVDPVIDVVKIRGRDGDVVITDDREPMYALGEVVLWNGEQRRISGIESFMVPARPGRRIGLHLVT